MGEAWDLDDHEPREISDYYRQLGEEQPPKDKSYEQYAEFKRRQMRRGLEL